jgi:hypothetical protein
MAVEAARPSIHRRASFSLGVTASRAPRHRTNGSSCLPECMAGSARSCHEDSTPSPANFRCCFIKVKVRRAPVRVRCKLRLRSQHPARSQWSSSSRARVVTV